MYVRGGGGGFKGAGESWGSGCGSFGVGVRRSGGAFFLWEGGMGWWRGWWRDGCVEGLGGLGLRMLGWGEEVV